MIKNWQNFFKYFIAVFYGGMLLMIAVGFFRPELKSAYARINYRFNLDNKIEQAAYKRGTDYGFSLGEDAMTAEYAWSLRKAEQGCADDKNRISICARGAHECVVAWVECHERHNP